MKAKKESESMVLPEKGAIRPLEPALPVRETETSVSVAEPSTAVPKDTDMPITGSLLVAIGIACFYMLSKVFPPRTRS